jgi:hypothetical protein
MQYLLEIGELDFAGCGIFSKNFCGTDCGTGLSRKIPQNNVAGSRIPQKFRGISSKIFAGREVLTFFPNPES